MLKVKKKIPNIKNKNQKEDVSQLHEEIKNSIKNLYISDQKKRKQLKNMQRFCQKLKINMHYYKKNIIKQRLNCKNINIIFKIYPKNHV